MREKNHEKGDNVLSMQALCYSVKLTTIITLMSEFPMEVSEFPMEVCGSV